MSHALTANLFLKPTIENLLRLLVWHLLVWHLLVWQLPVWRLLFLAPLVGGVGFGRSWFGDNWFGGNWFGRNWFVGSCFGFRGRFAWLVWWWRNSVVLGSAVADLWQLVGGSRFDGIFWVLGFDGVLRQICAISL